jgi:two-component system OmpR family sensor kinase
MSLRLRLTFLYSGLLVVVLGGLGVGAYSLIQSKFADQTRADLIAQAQYVLNNYDLVATFTSVRPALPRLNTFKTPGVYVELLGPGGNVVDRSPSLTGEKLPLNMVAFYKAKRHKSGFLRLDMDGDPLEVYYTPLTMFPSPKGRVDAIVLVGKSLSDTYHALHVITEALIAGGIILLVLFIVITWLVAGAALGPIKAMTRRAAAIAATRNFAGRVPVPSSMAELRQLALTFNHMLASLEQAHAAQQRFLADASHELRTPLTAVRANLDFLEGTPDAPAAERALALRAARKEAERMGTLVSDLLALSRADSGQAIERQPVELDRIVVDAYRRMRSLVQREGQSVRLTIAQLDESVVLGDADRLLQLVMILLDNALKYTPAGGQVTLALRRVSTTAVSISVADTGIGIPPEERERIFERFYRSPAARACSEGSGLGLPIARWIAQAHGGDIEVHDGPAGGSEFVVTLPTMVPEHRARATGAHAGQCGPADRETTQV